MGFPETFKALSDPVRREILVILRGGKLSAGEIAKEFNLTQATVSYHLNQLKKADLVTISIGGNDLIRPLLQAVLPDVEIGSLMIPTMAEDAGMDIGGTFIGMHMHPVVVPIHAVTRHIGEANLTMARTRPKYVGGPRAAY